MSTNWLVFVEITVGYLTVGISLSHSYALVHFYVLHWWYCMNNMLWYFMLCHAMKILMPNNLSINRWIKIFTFLHFIPLIDKYIKFQCFESILTQTHNQMQSTPLCFNGNWALQKDLDELTTMAILRVTSMRRTFNEHDLFPDSDCFNAIPLLKPGLIILVWCIPIC